MQKTSKRFKRKAAGMMAAVMMMRLCGDYLRKQTNILVCRMYGAVPARRLLLTVLVL